ncbi:MAG: hypothetical protein OEM18_00045 [Nitrosopumilus sp.]|nr:hypothetical protein [Nitrosopumilus sp.]
MLKIFPLIVIFLVITIVPAFAQIQIGEKVVQKAIEVMINSDGGVHVKHVIGSSNIPKQVELIHGTVSNLSVINKHGEEIQYSTIGDSNGVLILPYDEDSIITYDLQDVLSQKDNVWRWNFKYLEKTSFIFPHEVDLIFANERPVYLDEKRGITCHGCEISLEYSINEPKILENVKWEDKEFVVEIRSHSNINEFIFDQPTKSISFDISKENGFVTIIIPLELLWEPYTIFLDDEKIYFHEYNNNGTHVWLNIKPKSSGEISIIGTSVVPEFPIITPLAISFLIIVIIPIIKKINLH